jgi:pre-mRNA-splicing factor RBM22/SLT11
VRDHALGVEANKLAKSDVNREYQAEEMDRQAALGIDFESQYGKAKKHELLTKLQRTGPYYKRNRAHICSFFVRCECTRGKECPYR